MECEKPVSEVIEALGQGGGLVLRGILFEELEDAITLKVGASLFEIPRKYIQCMKEVKGGEGVKMVEVCIAGDAKLIQRTLVTVPELVGRGMMDGGGGGSGACQCACQCNCACDCACSQIDSFGAEMGRSGFRRRIGAAGPG